MKRIDLFEKALKASTQALNRAPYMFPLHSVIEQIRYLLDLETGKTADTSQLGAMTIGQITVRDIESFDSELADLLHEVSGEAQKMKP